MNKILTNNASHGQPLGAGHLDFLQVSNFLAFQQIGFSQNWAYAGVPSILYGCEKSVSGGFTTISAGAIFANNGTTGYEILLSPAVTFSNPTGSNVIIGNLDTTFSDPTPVLFDDGFTANVRQVRNVKWLVGVSGAGTIANYTDCNLVNPVFTNSASALNGLTVTFNANNTYARTGTAASTNTIIFDFTRAIVGNTVTIWAEMNATKVIAFAGAGATVTTGLLTAPASVSYVIIKATYMGDSGGTLVAVSIGYDV